MVRAKSEQVYLFVKATQVELAELIYSYVQSIHACMHIRQSAIKLHGKLQKYSNMVLLRSQRNLMPWEGFSWIHY